MSPPPRLDAEPGVSWRTVVRLAVLRHPVTALFGLTVAATSVLVTTMPVETSQWLAAGGDALSAGRWWTLVTALLVPDSLWDGVLSLVLIATVFAWAERLLGPRRVVAATALGVPALAVGAAIAVVLENWATGDLPPLVAAETPVLDPTVAIVAAIMTASAVASALWRRRIRMLGLAVLAMFALYAGDADSWYRLLAAGFGILAGVVVFGRTPRSTWHRSSIGETRSLVATFVAVSALGPLAALVTGAERGPFSLALATFMQYDARLIERCQDHYIPACDHEFALVVTGGAGAAILAVVPLVLMLLAAWGLRRGRRAAWVMALCLDVALAALGTLTLVLGDVSLPPVTDGTIVELALWVSGSILLPLVSAGILVVTARAFTVTVPRRASARFAITSVSAFVVLTALFAMIQLASRRAYPVAPTTLDLALMAVRRVIPPSFLIGFGEPPFPRNGPALIAYQWTGAIFWTVVIVAAVRLLHAPARPGDRDTDRYRALLRRGGGTMSFLGTWRGNDHWLSDDREAAVAYRVVQGVALAVGDPVCLPDRLGRTVVEFVEFAIQRGWTPVFYAVHDDTARALDELGWQRVRVAEETVLTLRDFDMSGSEWKKIRQPVNKAERDGIRAVWTSWRELRPDEARQLTEMSSRWAADKALPEMGFTLGSLDELDDPDVALLLALDRNDRVLAATSWLPSWQDERIAGWTLDFMRRRDDAPNGIMEFLIAKAATRMAAEGVPVLSLSGAPLATRPRSAASLDRGGAPLERGGVALPAALTWLAGLLEPAYGFGSLFRFKSKFRPEYRTLWMGYADPVVLPVVASAIARAYLPEARARDMLSLTRRVIGSRP